MDKIEALRAEIAALELKLTELRAQLKAAQADVGLNTYPSIEAIDWAAERYEDNAETRSKFNDMFFIWAWGGSKKTDEWYPPYHDVLVEGIGQIRRIGKGWDAEKGRGGYAGPDWVHISQGIVDVTAPMWVRRVDEDGKFDPAEMEDLVRWYSGGLRYPLSAWSAHSVGEAYRLIYLSTHTNPGGNYRSRQIPVTPAG